MTDSIKKTLIVSASSLVFGSLSIIGLFTLIDSDMSTRIEWAKAIGGFGTFAAAVAVVLGFKYTRDSIDTHTTQLRLEEVGRFIEQFHHACSELGSANEFSRIQALYEIRDLVFQYQHFYQRALGVICSFIRQPPYLDESLYARGIPRSDIGVCFEVFDDLYRFDDESWRWFGGNLRGATVVDVQINGIPFDYWNLEDTTWLGGSITNLTFDNTNLVGATFRDVSIRHVEFNDASLMFTTWDSVSLSYEYRTESGSPFTRFTREFAPPALQEVIDVINDDLSNGIRKEYEINVDGWAELD